ncbi:ABC transporter substrate-binding protein [Devosia sp. FJ2-5-3]|uniref:ABC transporter substrate-binding protein n=1 Tax=Devosia sp. FJ2-5-3 TaxID=2976680 RepID=UPI0023D820D9|nr:ABC transporter substrate-binding protein [Devosia sp. FJ2-5-3]WEJ56704.1 ABC transporter substrate-binding protein [Devosia sp. FJ2-5-3]
MDRLGRTLMASAVGALMTTTAFAQAMTDVGTPRSETLIVQTLDGRAANPSAQNPLNSYAIWRGFRELGWGYLWEMDTATGVSYPEMADGFPEVLNEENTQFRIKIREGITWSDGVEFTTDDIIFSLDTAFKYRDKLTNVASAVVYIKSYKKIDDYTFEVETVNPSYDLTTRLGVYTWGTPFNWVPKHVFEPLGDEVVTFQNAPAVTLGPYKIKEFDPNGFWQLWELRDDWQNSSWGNLGEPKPKYILYKDFGAEETRALAFVQNQYDVDTFMSPDSIDAAKARNPKVETFSSTFPYHDMNDACSYGVYINQQRAPYDMPEVRWALALSLNLSQVGISAMSGQFKAAALPLPDTPITGPIFYDANLEALKNLTIGDGYRPFDTEFSTKLVETLAAQGIDQSLLPTGDAVNEGFGVGWWKHDPAEAEKLLASVGMKKGSDGFYTLPDGSPWMIEFVIPGDWNKVLQRLGFSIADSWRQAGFNVNARQVDNGEFTTVQNTNARNELAINWSNTCVYNANWLGNWNQFRESNIKPADSTDPLSGNYARITDPKVLALVDEGAALPLDDPKFVENGQNIALQIASEMQIINLMNIPTTIPTNSTYWTNFPKQDNFYAAPYTWWSSFKKAVVSIEPTGQ